MNRYLLFTFDNYYPRGGWSDFHGDFETEEEAVQALSGTFDYYQVVDIETKSIVRWG